MWVRQLGPRKRKRNRRPWSPMLVPRKRRRKARAAKVVMDLLRKSARRRTKIRTRVPEVTTLEM